jgi:hypothetical protein
MTPRDLKALMTAQLFAAIDPSGDEYADAKEAVRLADLLLWVIDVDAKHNEREAVARYRNQAATGDETSPG